MEKVLGRVCIIPLSVVELKGSAGMNLGSPHKEEATHFYCKQGVALFNLNQHEKYVTYDSSRNDAS